MESSFIDTAYADTKGRRDPVESRVDALVAENRQIAINKILYSTASERSESQTMGYPLTFERSYSLFGLMLGGVIPFAMFTLFMLTKGRGSIPFFAVILLLVTNGTTAITGYFTGKAVGGMVRRLVSVPFSQRFLLSVLIGALWGMASGIAGGIILFGIGAVFGGVIGGVLGSIAMPSFTIPFLYLKRGEYIELKHFLPLSIGIVLIISAYLLGFLFR